MTPQEASQADFPPLLGSLLVLKPVVYGSVMLGMVLSHLLKKLTASDLSDKKHLLNYYY